MMLNHSITFDTLAAYICWLGGALLAIGDTFGFLPDDAGFLGIALIAAGHMISTHHVVAELERRERVAFDLGREIGPHVVRD